LNKKNIYIIKKQGISGFKSIEPLWRTKLWVDRISPIKTHSSMTLTGDYDMNIYNNTATYWFVKIDDIIVGCNSGFKTSLNEYRSRGIWIDENYRNLGLSKLLFENLFEQSTKELCSIVWSIPRKSAIKAYESVGFTQTSDWFNEGMEFGPNCYVTKQLITV